MQQNHQTSITIALLLSSLVVFVMVTWYILGTRKDTTADAPELNNAASSTTFISDNGEVVSLAEFNDTVRVINAWATWSPFSVQELQDLQTLANEYKDQQVRVIAVNRDEPQHRIDAFKQSLPELSQIVFLRDTEDGLYASFSGYAMPETLFYDRRGNLIHHQRGVLTLEEMRTYVEAAIASSK